MLSQYYIFVLGLNKKNPKRPRSKQSLSNPNLLLKLKMLKNLKRKNPKKNPRRKNLRKKLRRRRIRSPKRLRRKTRRSPRRSLR